MEITQTAAVSFNAEEFAILCEVLYNASHDGGAETDATIERLRRRVASKFATLETVNALAGRSVESMGEPVSRKFNPECGHTDGCAGR